MMASPFRATGVLAGTLRSCVVSLFAKSEHRADSVTEYAPPPRINDVVCFWSIFVCGTAAAASLGFINLWLLRRFHARARLQWMEKLKEREKTAYDLYDSLLQGTQAVILHLNTATLQINVSDADRKKLEAALAHSDSVLEEGRNRILADGAGMIETSDLATALAIVGEELSQAYPASFRVLTSLSPRSLHPAVRDELYRIGREVITNSFRHAGADAIEVEFMHETNQLTVRFRDNGKGLDLDCIDVDGCSDHRGLQEVKKRAKSIGGKLEIWSGKDAGTQIILRVPRSLAYRSPTAERRSFWRWKLSRYTEKRNG